jgi:ribosomal protein S18 acetylase RimI-like enzyme
VVAPPDARNTLRIATRADVPAIAAMHLASWRATYTSITPPEFMSSITLDGRIKRWEGAFSPPASETTATTVAVDGQRILGVCSFGPRTEPRDPTAGEIYSLHVGPDSLRTGLGRMLLDDALVRLITRGFTSVFLWVLRDNENARAFYEARRWSLTGEERTDERSGFAIAEVRYEIRISRRSDATLTSGGGVSIVSMY